MSRIQIVGAVLASGALSLGGVPIAATAGTPGSDEAVSASVGRLTIQTRGLPAANALAGKPRVTVAGPAGADSARTWRVRRERTIRGLAPGVYAVQTDPVTADKGGAYDAKRPARWIRVEAANTRVVRLVYAKVPDGSVIGHYINAEDMLAACQQQYDSGRVQAGYRETNDAFSLYCQIDGRILGGIDLERYCDRTFPAVSTGARLMLPNVWGWACMFG